MKQAFRLSRASAAVTALAIFFSAFIYAEAQAVSPSPDSFVVQITSTTIPPVPTPTPTATPSPSPTPVTALNRNSFAQDISGSGRFVVIESSGDISTERNADRNNADGNQEIFLFDYAQRRIFQITNTTNALKNTAASPIDTANIDVVVVNIRPMISHDGRFIVFASNAYSDANPALSPFNFNGTANAAALKADGNTEIFVYEIPAVADIDLSSGAEVEDVNLAVGGATRRLTSTPASAVPRPGTATVTPFFADDNRAPTLNDDGSIIAFVSTRNIANNAGVSNADGNPEIFLCNRAIPASPFFVQATNTTDVPPPSGSIFGTLIVNDNPSLSGNGSVLAFISNADINSTEADTDKRTGEIHLASFNGSLVSNVRAVTRTPPERRQGFEGTPVNFLSPGRRLSRDGNFVAFESLADLSASASTLKDTYGIYVYNVGANSFTQVINRVPADQRADIALRFPTFTGDSSRVVFASDLNLRPDGTIAASNATDALNPTRSTQIFSAPLSALTTVSRLTRQPSTFVAIQPLPSDTIRRVTFSLSGTELGGGNQDGSFEAFYLLVPAATSETPAPGGAAAPVSFFTGASERPVVAASPAPTPPAVTGLAPGMLGIARSTLALAPSPRQVDQSDADEQLRRPPLPVELNGVSVSISNAAAGLYFVSPGQINFVVPIGLLSSTTALPVVINNNGAVIRTSLVVNAAQPDIFTTTNGAAGRAAVLNVTNPCALGTSEPFAVTTSRPKGSATGVCTSAETETVPTELLIMLTGVRNVLRTQVTVRIRETDLTGDAIVSIGPSRTPGFDQIVVRLPATLAGAGDVPVIVTVTPTGGTAASSRPADTAPRITIQ
ncbi:MAG TPA: hypothetical protein VM934_09035 [Pyrinomonadaceae bacterium]|nr:hypothetical protein [Pyrinomonadaceae bacterium]